jgi:predicted secreted protein
MAEADNFEKIIRNERQVELFNEGYRYFDTRRWGTYLDEDANSSNWRGLDVTKDRTNANGNEGLEYCDDQYTKCARPHCTA